MNKLFLLIILILESTTFCKDYTITKKGNLFSQSKISIKVGDSIYFHNLDSTTHMLMYRVDGKRYSYIQKQGSKPIIQKFIKAETVIVRCSIHPKAKLVIKVN